MKGYIMTIVIPCVKYFTRSSRAGKPRTRRPGRPYPASFRRGPTQATITAAIGRGRLSPCSPPRRTPGTRRPWPVGRDAGEDVDPAGILDAAERRAGVEHAHLGTVGKAVDPDPAAGFPAPGEDVVARRGDAAGLARRRPTGNRRRRGCPPDNPCRRRSGRCAHIATARPPSSAATRSVGVGHRTRRGRRLHPLGRSIGVILSAR